MVVSKTRAAEEIESLISQGQNLFGENRMQEVTEKWPPLLEKYPSTRVHFIGHLQTNKTKQVVTLCHGLHSLDRPELARSIADALQKNPKPFDLYVQVNTGEEPQKGGIAPPSLSSFIDFCRSDLRLNITGLMCLPPVDAPPAFHFALLHKLGIAHGLNQFSMGMSDDFETAIRYQSTLIRIGSAIFEPKIAL